MGRRAEYSEGFAAAWWRPIIAYGCNGIPAGRPYLWRAWERPDASELERRARAAESARRARETVRERIRLELRAGADWIPAGFTEEELDAL